MIQPAIYSYSRISSKSQERGTGLAQQQLEDAKLVELSKTYGLPVSTDSFIDLGKSAYHGAHLAEGGALGKIITLINDGAIAPGSMLTIFNLDRLSRAKVNKALETFLRIINSDVMLYVATEDKVLSEHSPNLVPDLIMTLLTFARANDESVMKSRRTIGHALRMIEVHNKGDRSEDGYAFALKSVGSAHAFYLDVSDGVVRPHKYYWPVARLIADMFIAGKSVGEVKAVLDNQFTPPNPETITWQNMILSRFHNNDALTGSRTVNIQGAVHVLDDYYPRLLNDEELTLLKSVRSSRSTHSAPSGKVNLITGMGIARCHSCGGSLGSQSRGNNSMSVYCIRSSKRLTDCKGFSVKCEYVEQALLNLVPDAINAAARPKPVLQDLSLLTAKLSEHDLKLERMAEMAMDAGLPDALVAKMRELQIDRDDLATQIESIQRAAPVDVDAVAAGWLQVDGTLPSIEDSETRTRIKELVKLSLDKIMVQRLDGYSSYRFYFILKNGNTRTIDCIKGELFDMRTDGVPPLEITGMSSGSHARYDKLKAIYKRMIEEENNVIPLKN